MTAFPPEEVEVPAGRFMAIRVDYVPSSSKGEGPKWSWWFAPGVGRVKGRSIRMDGTVADWVLKSFTTPK